jgi:hypothetical protein
MPYHQRRLIKWKLMLHYRSVKENCTSLPVCIRNTFVETAYKMGRVWLDPDKEEL